MAPTPKPVWISLPVYEESMQNKQYYSFDIYFRAISYQRWGRNDDSSILRVAEGSRSSTNGRRPPWVADVAVSQLIPVLRVCV